MWLSSNRLSNFGRITFWASGINVNLTRHLRTYNWPITRTQLSNLPIPADWAMRRRISPIDPRCIETSRDSIWSLGLGHYRRQSPCARAALLIQLCELPIWWRAFKESFTIWRLQCQTFQWYFNMNTVWWINYGKRNKHSELLLYKRQA